ncbi:MAG TPA: DoxX family protein [Bryobacteraceae bacterium]|jgi:hypothetical protein|nr:DoxX family protein [Bryobacteraceae bacterium]
MSTTAIATPAREFRQPSPTLSHSRTRIWTGRILRGLAALFLLFDSGMKLVKPPFVVQASAQMGYPESSIAGIGVALLACTFCT